MEHVLNCVRQGYKYPWLRVLVVTGILITLVLAFLLPRLNVHADNTGWPSTYLGDNGRSNFNSSESIINQSTASSLQLQWTQKKALKHPSLHSRWWQMACFTGAYGPVMCMPGC